MKIPKGLKGIAFGTDRDSSKNYMGKVMALAAELPVGDGKLYDVEVRHDADCPAINGGQYCACDPDVVLVERKPTSTATPLDGLAKRAFQIDHEPKAANEASSEVGGEPDAHEDPMDLAVRLGAALSAKEIPGIVVVVDRESNMARCEFLCSEAQSVSLMTSVWTAAILGMPDDKKQAFMLEVIERANHSLFDPRGDLYRPYGSDVEPGEKQGDSA